MRYIYLTIALLGLSASSINAQKILGGMWQVEGYNVNLGIDMERYQTMSLERVLSFAANPEEIQRNLSNLTEEVYPSTAGVGLRFNVSLAPLRRSDVTYAENKALRVGFGIYPGKEAMVAYKNPEIDTSIVFCNMHTEMALETEYIWKGKWGKRQRWHWSIGGGANTGLTFANKMIIMSGKYYEPGANPSTQEEMDMVTFKAKRVHYVRAYVPFGLHYRVADRVTLGLDFRKGVGVQMVEGESASFLPRTGSVMLGGKLLI